jgi:hypothetical protein
MTGNVAGQEFERTPAQLTRYAHALGMEALVPGRYSNLLVFQIWALEQAAAVDARSVVDAIRQNEGLESNFETKPATEFAHEPLKGLWHKHFFSTHFTLHNVASGWRQGHIANETQRVLSKYDEDEDAEGAAAELVRSLTINIFGERRAAGRLTGEWIVFAKHEGRAYYLALAQHTQPDSDIHASISAHAYPQFPFLLKP